MIKSVTNIKTTRKAILLGLGLASISTLLAEVEIIALEGESIGVKNSYTYEGFSNPSLNQYGEIAFAANFEQCDTGSVGKYEGICLHNYQGTNLIAAADQIAPKPSDDGLFEYFYEPVLNDLGISYFRGKMQGSGWAVNTLGIWIGWTITQEGQTSSQMDMLARFWDQATINYSNETAENDGRYTQIGNPQIINPKSFGFMGMLDGEQYDGVTGAWHQIAKNSESWYIPSPELVAISGIPMPGNSDIVSKIDYYNPINQNDSLILAEIQTDSNTAHAIYLATKDQDSTLIAKTGDSSVLEGQIFASFGIPQSDENGNIVFWADLQTEEKHEGLFFYNGNSIESLISTNGELQIEGQAYSLSEIYDAKINKKGDIAFLGKLNTPDVDEYAIFAKKTSEPWRCIAQTGQQAIGTHNGAVFDILSSPTINETGQIAFTATLKGEGDTVSDTTDSGIWVTGSNEYLNLLIREGDTLSLDSEKLRTVSSFTIGGYNSDNEIALWLSFTNYSSGIAVAVVENALQPQILTEAVDLNFYDEESIELSVELKGTGPFSYQWIKDGSEIEGETNEILTISTFSKSDEGHYSLRITSLLGSTSSSVATISFSEKPSIPIFVQEPFGDIAFLGTSTTLSSVAVSDLEISYQWYKDGIALPTQVDSDLSITNSAFIDEGTYYVSATTSAGSVNSESVEILVTDQRMVNLSTRAKVGTGANVVISGFVIKGDSPKSLLIRGLGPTLSEFGLDKVLSQPQLTIVQNGQVIASNDGWSHLDNQNEIESIANQRGAFAINKNSQDAALFLTLDPGVYTAILNGENGESGIAMIEVYEIEEEPTRLVNLSTRAHVGIGAEIAIPGVVINGDLPNRVLIRAVGPTLKQQNLPGVLEDPILNIVDSTGKIIATNERWMDVNDLESVLEASETVGAFSLEDNSNDAALLIDLEPGLYTILVNGRDNSSGLALVELYDVPTK